MPAAPRPLLLLAALLVALSGCASAGASGEAGTDVVAAAEERVLIDVRTADEIADGYLEGAIHADFQSDDFATTIADLPRDEAYLVYCRTGNRSGQAIQVMEEMGFTDLVNGGAYVDLAAAGVPST